MIADLNDYVLFKIFSFCQLNDLKALHNVSTKLRMLIEQHFFSKTLDLLMTGHRNRGHVYQKTLANLSNVRRHIVSQRWRRGEYEELIFFEHRNKYFSQILLEHNFLYMTHGGQLRIHKRHPERRIDTKPISRIGQVQDPDITCLVKHRDTIFCGHFGGQVTLYSGRKHTMLPAHGWCEPLTSVDCTGDVFITASDQTTKVWRRDDWFDETTLELSRDTGESFKTVQISPNGFTMGGGKFIDHSRHALRLLDIETCTSTILNSDTRAIYDLLWRDEHTIFTGNFDSTFRVFDCRSNSDQQIWMDPFDSSVYCIAHDGNNAVLCGMKYHCRVNLYDLRMPKKFVQIFFPTLRNRPSSPVYSMACDSTQLFAATDHNLRILDFNSMWCMSKDYSNSFNHG